MEQTHLHIHQPSILYRLAPLLSIFAAIGLLTVGTLMLQGAYDLMSAMMYLMAYFFLVFGGFKLANLSTFAEAYASYDVLAMRSKVYALAYPFIEVTLGLHYFFDVGGITRDAFTAVIMLVGTYGVWRALLRKDEIPCACLGMVFHVPMTNVTLIENITMSLMALYMLSMYF